MTAVPWWADDDPWRLSPTEADEFEAKRRERAEEAAAIPSDPPF